MKQTMGPHHWAVLLLTATMFGSSFFFIKIAIDTIPAITLATGRAALAVPIALGILKISGARLPPWGADWIPLVILGALTAAIPYAAVAWGQVHIESGLAGILFGTIPVFSVILAPALARDETFTPGRLLGAAVGLAGVVMVMGPGALAGFGDQLLGTIVTLGAALSYALGGIYARRHKHLSPIVMTTGQLLTATFLLLPLSLVMDTPWTLAPSAAALGSLAAVAVVSTALPAFLLFWLIQRVGATNGSLLAFFMPVVAVTLGATILGETLPWQAFAGLGLIMLGAAAVNGRISLPVKAAASAP